MFSLKVLSIDLVVHTDGVDDPYDENFQPTHFGLRRPYGFRKMSDRSATVRAMYGDIDYDLDKHGWTTVQWGLYWVLALIAACLLMTGILMAISAFADARQQLQYDQDPTLSFVLSAGSVLVAVLAAWWMWDRLTTLFARADGGDAFLIWLAVTVLAAVIFSIGAAALGLLPRSTRGWGVCVAPMAILGFLALASEILGKAASALGISVGTLLLIGICGAVVLSQK
ncbi:DUF2157 domain-containing protein [Mycolicibacterium conceptionense]|uniref:DUF2157 domain-containing protein n=1 Tax=Mycolicibacterium conceptionense TaxID=451644 RepID=UPI000AEA5C98|nr:DUF2157 domain-containing protein [Mycolicibacterium conceptionense]